jgi:predicted anti-sigma-YlaC factor YlaD
VNGVDEYPMHPDLESYYDSATDRARVDLHIADCPECQAWLADIHERIGRFACAEFVELVTDYLDDAVDEKVHEKIDDHLRLCEGCRNYVGEVQATIATIGRVGDAGPDDPPEPVRAGLMAAFRLWRRPAASEPPRTDG